MKNQFKNKSILVTGGTGSIGSEIVRQLLKFDPKVVRIFARHEDRHHQLMQELGTEKVRFIVGDVRDKERLKIAMDGIDIVFHAAALKHVPICEYNPFEAVKTNIIGTQNVIEVAMEFGVDKVIGISTDKAVDPLGVLGVSKLMGEKLFLATYYYRGNKTTKFSCVRFGNVMGSRGSILPVFKKQILENGEVTVTDPKMTRFIMTVPQAVNLVLRAAALSQGQEIFILKMPSTTISRLAEAAISHYAALFGKKPRDIKMKIIGKRSGEKKHENLLSSHEAERALETKDMYILTPQEQTGFHQEYSKAYPIVRSTAAKKYFSSESGPKLSKSQLELFIKEVDLRQV